MTPALVQRSCRWVEGGTLGRDCPGVTPTGEPLEQPRPGHHDPVLGQRIRHGCSACWLIRSVRCSSSSPAKRTRPTRPGRPDPGVDALHPAAGGASPRGLPCRQRHAPDRAPGAGVDVWINTPLRPWEASGTSGMKVLVNGGLNPSVLDGWWPFRPEVGGPWGMARSTAAIRVWTPRRPTSCTACSSEWVAHAPGVHELHDDAAAAAVQLRHERAGDVGLTGAAAGHGGHD